jgi:hypothetical protein
MDLYSQPKPLTELMDYSVEDAPSVMEVRSDTIEPLNAGTYNYRFRLEPFGYLGEESMLLFKLTGGSDSFRANCMSGGLAAVKMARLSVGDVIVEETREFQQVAFSDMVVKHDRDSLQKYHAHYWGNAFFGEVDEAANAAEASGTGQIVMGSDSGIYFGTPAAGTNRVVRSAAITANKDNNYQVGIRLGQLFKSLDGRTLPLFLFDEYRIYIDIEFNDGSVFVNDITTGSATATYKAAEGVITATEVKLQVDYLILPQSLLEADRDRTNREGGLQLVYPTYKVIEKTLGAGAAGIEQQAEFRLGLSDLEVHSITMIKKLTTADGAGFVGRNRSLLLGGQISDGMPQEKYQVEVNGLPQYPFFKEHKASQHDQMEYSAGDTVKMERPFYFTDKNDINSELTPKTSGLQGTYSPLAISLRSGVPAVMGGGTTIGQYPVLWRYRRTPENQGSGLTLQNDTTGSMDLLFIAKVSSMTTVKSTTAGMKIETVGI